MDGRRLFIFSSIGLNEVPIFGVLRISIRKQKMHKAL
jgi:hypothetical protein